MRPAALLLALLVFDLRAAQTETTPIFGTTVVISSGLRGVIYHIHRGSLVLPDFHKLKPAGVIYTSSLDIPAQDFRAGFPGVTKRNEWFAIDYAGRFWIEDPATYTFSLLSDDGAMLYIDDAVVIDNDGLHPPREKRGDVYMTRGVHSMRVSYFQGPRLQVALQLKVAGPGKELRIFSTDEFKPPSDLEWPPR
jgi:PA14 domain-containing protein